MAALSFDINDMIRRTMKGDQPIISSIFSHLADKLGCSQSKHTIRHVVATKGRGVSSSSVLNNCTERMYSNQRQAGTFHEQK